MSLNQSFILNFEDGNSFDLHFSEISIDTLPIKSNLPIIDISLKANNANLQTSAKDLFKIADNVKEYLLERNVILYYYCDTKPITNNFRQNISPQQFRFQLFSDLFERKNLDVFAKENIIIMDAGKEFHYICLISRKENNKEIELIANELQKLQK